MTGGVNVGGDPSMKNATHSTTVPLYSGRASIVRVPGSMPGLTPGIDVCPSDVPFTLQPRKSASE